MRSGVILPGLAPRPGLHKDKVVTSPNLGLGLPIRPGCRAASNTVHFATRQAGQHCLICPLRKSMGNTMQANVLEGCLLEVTSKQLGNEPNLSQHLAVAVSEENMEAPEMMLESLEDALVRPWSLY